jgi:phosphotransferase system HPr (HPr) family protein
MSAIRSPFDPGDGPAATVLACAAEDATPSLGSMAPSNVARRELTVALEQGLHVVPCSMIAKTAREFPGAVRIRRGEVVADATSIFDLLGLNAEHGTVLTLEADGEGAAEFLDRLVALFESGFEAPR